VYALYYPIPPNLGAEHMGNVRAHHTWKHAGGHKRGVRPPEAAVREECGRRVITNPNQAEHLGATRETNNTGELSAVCPTR
jgi:hypothetical protein